MRIPGGVGDRVGGGTPVERPTERDRRRDRPKITQKDIPRVYPPGSDIIVQVTKGPIGTKGPRVTTNIVLPGRYLVLLPNSDQSGISRKIENQQERQRLKKTLRELTIPESMGVIMRTVGEGQQKRYFVRDLALLLEEWRDIQERIKKQPSASCVFQEPDLIERTVRDFLTEDVERIVVDSPRAYERMREMISKISKRSADKVKVYSEPQPIFDRFNITRQLENAFSRQVHLKSGGYIVVDETEALVAIDVNTGKFVGKGSTRLEDTIVKTNLEAVKEIVRQIRLRDLGGIIVVDFIDMEERRNREKVLSALQQALEEDKAPSKALSFNEFGLVCITRKRTKQALERVLCQPCPYCTGSGMVKSIPTLCYEIQAEARKMATPDHEGPNLTIRVNPEIAKALKTRESMLIDELEQTSHKHIIIQSDATLHWEQYDIY